MELLILKIMVKCYLGTKNLRLNQKSTWVVMSWNLLCLNFIPKNKTYGMDDVIKKAISKRKTVNSILIKKGFVDVGDKKTYEKLRLEHKKRGKI